MLASRRASEKHSFRQTIEANLARRTWLLDVFALAFLLAAVLYLFKDTLQSGLIYYEADTLNFYYPIFVAVQEYLRRGVFPLIWTPNILGGFPLFADGEAGMLYPLNLAAMFLLPAAQAFASLIIIRFFLAAAFMYAFARSLDTRRLGAIVAAMVFAFGSFLIAQIQHTNLSNSAIWLPLILLFVEKGLRSSGIKRDAYLAVGGIVLAVQMLAVHVQPVIMTLMAVALYVCLRAFIWPVEPCGQDTTRLIDFARRATLLSRALVIILAIGLALAAVQLVPLYELSAFSFRSVGSDYRFASTYSSTIFNLSSLVFPYFFRAADGSSWSIWGAWEPTIYIGIAPLVLAGIGVLFVRNRYVLLFAVIAVVGLAISLGPYSPLPLHWLLWHLPGFSSLRAPGRFNFLFLFAAAMLAAFGTRWLLNRVTDRRNSTARSGQATWLFAAYLAAWGAFGLWLVWTLRVDEDWLLSNKRDALSLIKEFYVSLFGNPLNLTAAKVYDGLLHAVSLSNPQTVTSLIILAGALLLLWFGFRRSRRLGGGLLILLIAVDLLPYGQAFHPSMPLETLSPISGAVSFLGKRPERVFNRGTIPSLEPNRLLPFDIPAFGGYSSLHPGRFREYEWWLAHGNNVLPDLAGVRYVIEPKNNEAPPGRRVHRIEGVYVDPEMTLTSGGSQNPNSRATFVSQPTQATSVRLVATLNRALDIPQGEVVAEIVAHGEGGERQTLQVRAGQHVSESAYDRPDVLPNVKHHKAPVALTLQDTDHLGRRQSIYLYYAELSLLVPMKVSSLDFRYIHPKGRVSLYGLSLFNKDAAESTQVRANGKYHTSYEDDETVISENTTPLPRAFVVTSVRVMPSDPTTLGEMAEGDVDVTSTAIVEEEIPGLKAPGGENPARALSPAQITYYSPNRVTVEAETPAEGLLILTDSYYPGWAATVDGQPQTIYRADYLFRGVPLGPGRHEVEFIYDPMSLKVGAGISLAATSVLVLVGCFWLWRRR